MTKTGRDIIIYTALAVALLLSVGTLIFCVLSALGGGAASSGTADTVQVQIWWLAYRESSAPSPAIWTILSVGALCAFAVVFILQTVVVYRKTGASEVLLFSLFLASLCFEGFRIVQFFLFDRNLPLFIGVILTRLTLFGRVGGTVFLFTAAIFAIGPQYQKYGIALGIGIVLALACAYFLPIDSFVFLSHFIYRVGQERSLFFLWTAIELFTIASFAGASISRGNQEHIFLGVAVLCLMLGRDAIEFSGLPWLAPIALLLLSVGAVLYLKKAQTLYTWM